MYKHIKMKASFLMLVLLLIVTSCTDDYSEINRDTNSIAVIGEAELPFLFTKALDAINWTGQTSENLYSAQYCQYFANLTSYFPTDQYEIEMSWALHAWQNHFVNAMPQLQTIMKNTEPTSGEYTLARIWMAYSTHRTTDYWGPIPYSQAGEPALTVAYDSQKDIYYDLFKELTESVAVLEGMKGQNVFGDYDIIYGGDINKWIKFANTLRLRLALRISNIDPAKAKTEAEAAYAAGVMESNDDNARALNSIEDDNFLSHSSEWNEFRMSAAMESVMKGYDDPRISVYWIPAFASGTYEGLRNGLSAVQLGDPKNKAKTNSHIGPQWTSPESGGIDSYLTTSHYVMSAAEAYFLRAEGALLGWNMGGTVKNLYETGITMSMNQWGVTNQGAIFAYLSSTKVPIAPNDYLNSPALNDITIKFDNTDTNKQLEQIAMQKWLALFPDGWEAWSDYRRRPSINLYPVANSKNPDIPDPTKEYIRRIPFLVYEYQSNTSAVEDAIQLLKVKEDKITTPLWWDVN